MENINRVEMAGKVQKVTINADSVFFLVNVGLEKWVPCTGHAKEDKAPAGTLENLQRFEEGDEIHFKGYTRPWSQKSDGGWKNGLDIRITELNPKCIPQRSAKTGGGQGKTNGGGASGWGGF